MSKMTVYCFLFAVLVLTTGVLAFGQVTVCTVPNSDPSGNCGPYNTYDVTGATGGNVNVQQDFWNQANAPSGSTQTLYAISPEYWYADANFPAGNTAVETYPDSDAIYTAASPLVTSYSYLYSGYAGNMNANTNTSAEAAYDILLNGGAANSEVMIWTDRSNRSLSGCTSKATNISFGGTNGVPVEKWDLCRYGSTEMVWSLDQASLGSGTPTVYGVPAGSVDIYAMLMWLEKYGYLASSTYLTQIEYGFEIASTGGHSEEFQVTGFTISASHT